MATGMFYADNRLVVAGRQTGQIFVYDTQTGGLISKFHNGLEGVTLTFLNDTTFAADGSAYVTDSVNPVLYRVAPAAGGKYELQEFLKFEGTPIKYVKAPGAPGINVNGIVATADGRFLINHSLEDAASPIILVHRQGEQSSEVAAMVELIREVYREEGITFGA